MTKITVIGAGSASFGENTLAAIMRSKKLHGSHLALVDRNAQSLDIVHRLANRLNKEWDADFTISAHTNHKDALDGANFVVSAIEVGPREELWKSDYEITLKYGVHQPYAENGGPGGFIHAARNIKPLMEIVRDMEQACPDAWFINFTNPMVRICDAVNRHSKIKVVGLCHQIYTGYGMVGVALAKELGIQVPEGLEGMHADVMQHPLQHDGEAADRPVARYPRRRNKSFFMDTFRSRQTDRRGFVSAFEKTISLNWTKNSSRSRAASFMTLACSPSPEIPTSANTCRG